MEGRRQSTYLSENRNQLVDIGLDLCDLHALPVFTRLGALGSRHERMAAGTEGKRRPLGEGGEGVLSNILMIADVVFSLLVYRPCPIMIAKL